MPQHCHNAVKFDLHSHTTCSDGHLTPTELLQRATDNGVDCLAITDHDTVAAYEAIASVDTSAIDIVTGIELSTRWRGRGVHVIGLNIDIGNKTLLEGIALQQLARVERGKLIAKRLQACGLHISYSAVADAAEGAIVGRPHFARALVAGGFTTSEQQAFKKYLGNGKTGDVRHHWPELPEVISWITAAGGIATLAHPLHYRLTRTKLSELLRDFIAAGGRAMEVVSGQQSPTDTRLLTEFCDDFDLLASIGSDFHRPGNSWSDVGKLTALPKTCVPVWQAWRD